MSKKLNDNTYIYLDKEKCKCTVFNKNNYVLYNIPFYIGEILNDVIKLNDDELICNKYNIKISDLKKLVDKFNSIFDEKNKKENFQSCNNKILKVLRLIISNTCNLKCKYCYADEGTYKGKKKLMEIEESKQIIDELLKHFESIEEISFFGGEPLLNIKVVEFVCEYLTNKCISGELKNVPIFSMVTNGTLINEEVINIIKKYNLHITVSIDGPKDINDELRIDKFGIGKFDLIKKNIMNLRKNTIEPSMIECTYTAKHAKKGYNNENLQEFLRDEFDVKTILINAVDIHPNNRLYEELNINKSSISKFRYGDLEERFNHFLESDIFDADIVRFITTINNKNKKYSNYYCNAGIEQLAINTNGDIYPCQLFVGLDNNKFYMGNILNDGLINSNYKTVKNILLSNSKCNNDKCIECSEKNDCNSCIGIRYKTSGTLSPVSDKSCSRVKEYNEKFIEEIIKIYTDERKYKLLTKRLKELKNYYKERGVDL